MGPEPAPLSFRARPRTSYIVVHDTGPASWPPEGVRAVDHLRLRAYERGLLEVGYHYVIEEDGQIYATRRHAVMGSHCPGRNHESLGVCVAGDTSRGLPEAQAKALGALLLCRSGTYPEAQIVGFSELLPARRGPAIPRFSLGPYRTASP